LNSSTLRAYVRKILLWITIGDPKIFPSYWSSTESLFRTVADCNEQQVIFSYYFNYNLTAAKQKDPW